MSLDLLARPLWKISWKELSIDSLHKTSMRDLISIQDLLKSLDLLGLFTAALYKISSQDLYERSLYKSSLQDLGTGPAWEIPIRPLSDKTPMRGLYTRSDISGPPGKTSVKDLLTVAPYKISSQERLKNLISINPWTSQTASQELSTRSLDWDISIQDLLISLDLLGLFPGALYEISTKDLYERSLYKSSLQDLFTRPHMRDLYTISPDILGPPRSPHRSFLQDLFTRL